MLLPGSRRSTVRGRRQLCWRIAVWLTRRDVSGQRGRCSQRLQRPVAAAAGRQDAISRQPAFVPDRLSGVHLPKQFRSATAGRRSAVPARDRHSSSNALAAISGGRAELAVPDLAAERDRRQRPDIRRVASALGTAVLAANHFRGSFAGRRTRCVSRHARTGKSANAPCRDFLRASGQRPSRRQCLRCWRNAAIGELDYSKQQYSTGSILGFGC